MGRRQKCCSRAGLQGPHCWFEMYTYISRSNVGCIAILATDSSSVSLPTEICKQYRDTLTRFFYVGSVRGWISQYIVHQRSDLTGQLPYR